jgi:hypothetical protein
MKRLKRIANLKLQISIMLICSFNSFIVNGQSGLDNLWLTGYFCCSSNLGGSNLDFYNGNPVINSAIRNSNFNRQFTAISDSLGNLLFYTNGIFIYDASDSLMQNSDTLGLNSCTAGYIPIGGGISQGSVLIPRPNSNKNYYLFNESCDYTSPAAYPKKLAVAEIDMSLNNGLGAVVYQDSVLSNLVLTWGGAYGS